MKKQIQMLMEFHATFGVEYALKPKDSLDFKTVELRRRIMAEEVKEWYRAHNEKLPISARAKELADILYTVYGTIISEGLQDQIEDVFEAVHRSNMSKRNRDGSISVREDGKILKGDNYHEPQLHWLDY